MKAQHTPRPWTYSYEPGSGINGFDEYAIWSGAHYKIHVADVSASEKTKEEMEADARLIATAPLMYDVLCDLRDRIKACANLPISTNEVFDSLYAELINDTLAQAKGAA